MQAPDEGPRLSRIKRDLKERLFRDGVIDVQLRDMSLYLELNQFLETEQWDRFQSRLREAQGRCIDQIDYGYWNSWGNSAVRIVITGGGAYLPLTELQAGRIGERNVACQAVEAFPEALRFKYQEMTAELPRLVVAIGGASDELPDPLDRKHVPRDPHPVGKRHLDPVDKTATGFEETPIII